ncbi:thioredoxin-disulfide reductase [Natronomonas pharaonis DSM 2160]|uniref:Thioredoxin-disulfide reductase n=2 Tax=Natronomonas pharaonis TaxID=2257 RepID=A0A1U7EUV2_NATPD|nr:NAD(P)/FAD-dependent oxidoreductase [Natronomonas pharaonis]CAI48785.1 thioredoxin-disulfide reductase [Natronomonas pharaonis DSM 2160]
MTDHYEVTVVGGGPAGLTTALYTTRLGHDTAVINRGGGRAAMMLDTHNVIGITEDTSGNELLSRATEQIQEYGADYHRGTVTDIQSTDEGFAVTAGDTEVTTEHVVLATGFSDKRPDPPLPRTGKGLHYCLHCDAYMFVDEPVYVMGTSESAAHVAMIMLNFTPDVDLLTRGEDPEWSDETDTQLRNHPVEVVHEDITGLEKDDDGWLSAFEFEDGTVREYRGGFPMYGSEYNTDLAESLGVELNDDGTIGVDDHGRTNVDGVYAVGDVTPGHNQIPVAMGEGARCGIGNHYDLRAFPRSLDDIESEGPVTEADVPAVSEKLKEAATTHEGHPGAGEAAGDD